MVTCSQQNMIYDLFSLLTLVPALIACLTSDMCIILQEDIPKAKYKSYGQRLFAYQSSSIGNLLPFKLWYKETLVIFTSKKCFVSLFKLYSCNFILFMFLIYVCVWVCLVCALLFAYGFIYFVTLSFVFKDLKYLFIGILPGNLWNFWTFYLFVYHFICFGEKDVCNKSILVCIFHLHFYCDILWSNTNLDINKAEKQK